MVLDKERTIDSEENGCNGEIDNSFNNNLVTKGWLLLFWSEFNQLLVQNNIYFVYKSWSKLNSKSDFSGRIYKQQ